MARAAVARPPDDPAILLIEAHDRVCTERMMRIDEFMERIDASLTDPKKDGVAKRLQDHDDRFDKLNTAAWGVAGSLGLLAVSIIGYLLVVDVPSLRPQSRYAAPPAATAQQQPAR